jgi:hypothetical protein
MTRPVRLRSSALAAVIDFAIFFYLNPATPTYALSLRSLAGAEGFEPPSSVLETDSLTVELTPLN